MVTRAVSVAPSPKIIAGLGKFQDRGLKHNKLLRLGLKEIRVLYPNDPLAKRSALKVLLGTGKAVDNDSGMDGSRSWWRDIWFIRLGRALWSSIDRDRSDDTVYSKRLKRDDLKSGVRTRQGEYFRFNIEFIGRKPRLDDASRIPEIKIQACNAILCSADSKQDLFSLQLQDEGSEPFNSWDSYLIG
ncbi:hypothetical protein OIDMADRAFT_36092 [Oidiodendron maius Zn]|uniref:Uncharacterized protein n=1 Tax=Oidiodendron maius (strain Zn) TaxID=913774 RepID=A0A0C3GND6_OIDMZ|nr:hypothetical protein OIDMADRAFT_36092 [Oidiodendron maius Zn]